MRPPRLLVLLAALYFFGAAFTYGYTYREEFRLQQLSCPSCVTSTRTIASIDSVFTAMFWPLYWPFHLSRIAWSKVP